MRVSLLNVNTATTWGFHQCPFGAGVGPQREVYEGCSEAHDNPSRWAALRTRLQVGSGLDYKQRPLRCRRSRHAVAVSCAGGRGYPGGEHLVLKPIGCTAIRSVAMRKPLSIKSRTGSGIDTRRSLGYANEPDAEGLWAQ
jgi:hypothetical protein